MLGRIIRARLTVQIPINDTPDDLAIEEIRAMYTPLIHISEMLGAETENFEVWTDEQYTEGVPELYEFELEEVDEEEEEE